MPSYEVSATASFFVQADSKEQAGHLLDDWWRLVSGADVEKSYELLRSGFVYPRHWRVGYEKAVPPGDHPTQGRQIQDMMNRHREKLKLDADSIKLIEEAEHEFEDV